VLVAGSYWNHTKLVCGVFLIHLQSGDVTQIIRANDCEDAFKRTDISLSPNTDRAVAIFRGSLELIDTLTGTSKTLGVGYEKVSWSPDGQWVAAAVQPQRKQSIVLYESKSFSQVRRLGSFMALKILWSPDSRYLLTRTLEVGCAPDQYTYEIFEVSTGRSSIVESSHCKVSGGDNDVGWVEKAAFE
jgi:WD40 repeat protein